MKQNSNNQQSDRLKFLELFNEALCKYHEGSLIKTGGNTQSSKELFKAASSTALQAITFAKSLDKNSYDEKNISMLFLLSAQAEFELESYENANVLYLEASNYPVKPTGIEIFGISLTTAKDNLTNAVKKLLNIPDTVELTHFVRSLGSSSTGINLKTEILAEMLHKRSTPSPKQKLRVIISNHPNLSLFLECFIKFNDQRVAKDQVLFEECVEILGSKSHLLMHAACKMPEMAQSVYEVFRNLQAKTYKNPGSSQYLFKAKYFTLTEYVLIATAKYDVNSSCAVENTAIEVVLRNADLKSFFYLLERYKASVELLSVLKSIENQLISYAKNTFDINTQSLIRHRLQEALTLYVNTDHSSNQESFSQTSNTPFFWQKQASAGYEPAPKKSRIEQTVKSYLLSKHIWHKTDGLLNDIADYPFAENNIKPQLSVIINHINELYKTNAELSKPFSLFEGISLNINTYIELAKQLNLSINLSNISLQDLDKSRIKKLYNLFHPDVSPLTNKKDAEALTQQLNHAKEKLDSLLKSKTDLTQKVAESVDNIKNTYQKPIQYTL